MRLPDLPLLRETLTFKQAIVTKTKRVRRVSTPLFEEVDGHLECDAGLFPRVWETLEMNGYQIEIEGSWTIIHGNPDNPMVKSLAAPEQRVVEQAIDQVIGGYAVVPENFDLASAIAAIVRSYKGKRILVTVSTRKERKALKTKLNRLLRKDRIHFEEIGERDVPHYAICTHELFKQVPSDSVDIVIATDCHRCSSNELQRKLRWFDMPRFGFTKTKVKGFQDKGKLLESLFGSEVKP